MLFIPYGAELGLGRRSYVTYIIIVLCLLIYIMQDSNKTKINLATSNYCTSIHKAELNPNSLDILRENLSECHSYLRTLHNDVNGDLKKLVHDHIDRIYAHLDLSERKKILSLVEHHYEEFSLNSPASLDARLMYYPNSWNPFTSITSTLAHGDWWHIIGNLLFFMAFAPAIEVLIGSRLNYIGFLLAISLVTSFSYSLATLLGQSPVPTLGLSGVVMGMIGMSAFLMPKVRIRVFVWFFVYVKNFYLRAWILALWYIGWDTWDMLTGEGANGINLVAHVSGGFTGYLLGYFFLKERREDIHDELHDEIKYAQSMRVDGGNFSTHVGVSSRVLNQEKERQAIKSHDEFLSRLHKYIREKESGNAIVHLLDNYDVVPSTAELYETLFFNMSEWGKSRALLCVGRAAIHLLLINKLTPRALVIVEQCQQIDENFCLAEPGEVLSLARSAKEQEKYDVAYLLIRRAGTRYNFLVDVVCCKLLEAELLWHYLNQPDEARQQMQILLNMSSNVEKEVIHSLANIMEVS